MLYAIAPSTSHKTVWVRVGFRVLPVQVVMSVLHTGQSVFITLNIHFMKQKQTADLFRPLSRMA